ncbi:helix-turn-helix domain-containing protein [Chlorogloea sp. CCALA 695]|uniref:helix-turn-helix domain-containing protein n=1 Tax=Chlorogloea sp. CCALA 695 TaxID=2107693 RepID=UPI000D055A90|nr:helix-turn-helix transcriptional regulator [Chlorogloea sp. CCALA 695]PSB25570.1 XRE family transcriptional regulator [Chlorogloea sp. CCALA 695]
MYQRGWFHKTTFGQVIRTARISIGYSQRELAALVEIDFTYLSKLESDSTEYPPKEYLIQQLAYYLGLDREELMCLTGRLPERYQDFLKQNYKAMPALFRWMRQKPDFIIKAN